MLVSYKFDLFPYDKCLINIFELFEEIINWRHHQVNINIQKWYFH